MALLYIAGLGWFGVKVSLGARYLLLSCVILHRQSHTSQAFKETVEITTQRTSPSVHEVVTNPGTGQGRHCLT